MKLINDRGSEILIVQCKDCLLFDAEDSKCEHWTTSRNCIVKPSDWCSAGAQMIENCIYKAGEPMELIQIAKEIKEWSTQKSLMSN